MNPLPDFPYYTVTSALNNPIEVIEPTPRMIEQAAADGVDAVRRMRYDLELAIGNKIREFESRTGLLVDYVGLEHARARGINDELIGIKIILQVPR